MNHVLKVPVQAVKCMKCIKEKKKNYRFFSVVYIGRKRNNEYKLKKMKFHLSIILLL